MEIDISINLITCPECHIVFQYYDFLSHSNTCTIHNNTTNISDMNTEVDSGSDNDMDTDMDTDIHMNIDNRINSLNRFTGLNDYGNYSNNLYNPMIHRGFQNDDDNNNNINILNNYISSLSINTNTNTNIQCIGLTKIEFENNSKIIELNEQIDCSICLCNYPKNTHFYLMNCKHLFCIECSNKWFSKNSLCPLCRTNYKKL